MRPAALAVTAVAALAVLAACGTETGNPGAAQPGGGSASSAPGSGTVTMTDLPTSPPGKTPPVAGEPTGPVLQLKGVAEAGVEPGCVLLRADSKSYLLVGAKAAKIPTDVPITVTGQVLAGTMSYCQQGTPLRVDSVTRP